MYIIIIIIIIILIILISLAIFYLTKEQNKSINHKMIGGDYKLLFDLGLELDDLNDIPSKFKKNIERYNKNHINFINTICEYINNVEIDENIINKDVNNEIKKDININSVNEKNKNINEQEIKKENIDDFDTKLSNSEIINSLKKDIENIKLDINEIKDKFKIGEKDIKTNKDIKNENIETKKENKENTINNYTNLLIVGDVHGSILQLLMPLKQAGILKNINFKNNKFEYELNLNSSNSQVIYCGDFFGRAKHPLTIELISTFIDIYITINNKFKDKIVWVFGNHDVGFIKNYCYNHSSLTTGLSKVEEDELKERIKNEKEIFKESDETFENLKNKLINIVEINNYPCIYVNHDSSEFSSGNKIIVSHTIIPIEKIETEEGNIYTSIIDIYNNYLDFLNITKPNSDFNKLNFDEQIKIINNIAKCVIKNNGMIINNIEKSLYWLKPIDVENDKNTNIKPENKIFNKLDYNYFIGHNIIYSISDLLDYKFNFKIYDNIIEFKNNVQDFINIYNNSEINFDLKQNKIFNNIYPIDFNITTGITPYLGKIKNKIFNDSIEIGFNMSIFVIYNLSNDLLKLSKLYLI